jgi:hypothetical protein
MKNVEMLFFELLRKDVLQKLCKEVKETVATEVEFPEVKAKKTSFGIADLWNIRRNKRTARGRWNNKHSVLFIR